MRILFLPVSLAVLLGTATAATLAIPEDLATGVYVSDGAQWKELPVESVQWKTGHSLIGVVHTNGTGKVEGKASAAKLVRSGPLDVVIRAGNDEKYQLVRLQGHAKDRDFEGRVPVTIEKAGAQLWRAQLDTLPDGEYGLISSEKTKIYTFSITGRTDELRTRARAHRYHGDPALDF